MFYMAKKYTQGTNLKAYSVLMQNECTRENMLLHLTLIFERYSLKIQYCFTSSGFKYYSNLSCQNKI